MLRFSTTTFDTSSTKHPSTDSCSEASTTWFGSLPQVAELELETWPIGNDLRKKLVDTPSCTVVCQLVWHGSLVVILWYGFGMFLIALRFFLCVCFSLNESKIWDFLTRLLHIKSIFVVVWFFFGGAQHFQKSGSKDWNHKMTKSVKNVYFNFAWGVATGNDGNL